MTKASQIAAVPDDHGHGHSIGHKDHGPLNTMEKAIMALLGAFVLGLSIFLYAHNGTPALPPAVAEFDQLLKACEATALERKVPIADTYVIAAAGGDRSPEAKALLELKACYARQHGWTISQNFIEQGEQGTDSEGDLWFSAQKPVIDNNSAIAQFKSVIKGNCLPEDHN